MENMKDMFCYLLVNIYCKNSNTIFSLENSTEIINFMKHAHLCLLNNVK